MKNNEIGSEFWKDSTRISGEGVSQLLPDGFNIKTVLSGRTALDLVIRDAIAENRIRSVYLPSYCCHTMIEPFVRHGISVRFYSVSFIDSGISVLYDEDNDCELVYLMDYFGFVSDSTSRFAEDQKAKGKIVVYDATHSIFCQGMDYGNCDYVFGSFRKWFGVNAAFCSKKTSWRNIPSLKENTVYTNMRNRAFELKKSYIEDGTDVKATFLAEFAKAEEMLEFDYCGYAADSYSLQILKGVDCRHIFDVRRRNVKYLMNLLQEQDGFALPFKSLKEGECPLFLPVRVAKEKRAELRSYFIKNGIYLPVHWPISRLHEEYGAVCDAYLEELSIVCDQRYSTGDMENIIKVKSEFYNQNV